MFNDGREFWLLDIYPQYKKVKSDQSNYQLTFNQNNDNVMVKHNTINVRNKATLISRTKEFLFHNTEKNKCIKINVEKPELLQCGSGGEVTFVGSAQPDPNLK